MEIAIVYLLMWEMAPVILGIITIAGIICLAFATRDLLRKIKRRKTIRG